MLNNEKRIRHHRVEQKGFTLVELVVSLGLFLFILSISLGGLLHVVDMSRKTEAMRVALDNLNLAMEEMSRNIRQGYNYHCGSGGAIDELEVCWPTSSSFFAFEPHDGDPDDATDQTVYRLNGSQIEKSQDSGTTWRAITSPEIIIDQLTFYFRGRGGNDEDHALVTIIVHGIVASGTEYESDFTVQTSVAQRSLNR